MASFNNSINNLGGYNNSTYNYSGVPCSAFNVDPNTWQQFESLNNPLGQMNYNTPRFSQFMPSPQLFPQTQYQQPNVVYNNYHNYGPVPRTQLPQTPQSFNGYPSVYHPHAQPQQPLCQRPLRMNANCVFQSPNINYHNQRTFSNLHTYQATQSVHPIPQHMGVQNPQQQFSNLTRSVPTYGTISNAPINSVSPTALSNSLPEHEVHQFTPEERCHEVFDGDEEEEEEVEITMVSVDLTQIEDAVPASTYPTPRPTPKTQGSREWLKTPASIQVAARKNSAELAIKAEAEKAKSRRTERGLKRKRGQAQKEVSQKKKHAPAKKRKQGDENGDRTEPPSKRVRTSPEEAAQEVPAPTAAIEPQYTEEQIDDLVDYAEKLQAAQEAVQNVPVSTTATQPQYTEEQVNDLVEYAEKLQEAEEEASCAQISPKEPKLREEQEAAFESAEPVSAWQEEMEEFLRTGDTSQSDQKTDGPSAAWEIGLFGGQPDLCSDPDLTLFGGAFDLGES